MKTEMLLVLHENDKNKKKAEVLQRIEILFDDEENKLPDEWFSFWSDDIPWNSKVKITLEIVD